MKKDWTHACSNTVVTGTWAGQKARAVYSYAICTRYTCKQTKAFHPMPALLVAGVRWHIGSDDVPLFAIFGSAFHAIWIVVILLTSQGVLNMPNQCHHEGRQYIATVVGLLFCFTFGFVVEILLIWEGCKGAPFELSKRKKMRLFLLCRLANVIQETVITAYGTYVVFGTSPRCKVEEEIIWDPRKEVKVLVCLTWGFQLVVLLNSLLWYNAWPEKQATLVWENRFKWIGKWLLCIRNPDTIETRQTSLRRIARWVTQLVGHVDLTPSDIVLALILTATLQRRRRRKHIMHSLRADKKGDKGSSRATAPPQQAISLANADSAPLPAGFQFSSSPTTSAMYAGPPLDILERELTKSQVMGVVPDCVCGCEHADLMPQTALSSQDHAMGGVMIKMPKNG